ncbi:uncharacterized protein LOC117187400 [Drosophila miranda]|uniref:uncharacterized protein LOC117187339 n=1 Tax=Drosophila miranda TaxID=7229 RepID=UPI00143F2111|nr:uncharacterized protein LOC117187339 [Drosophila miranda]XP_033245889.1 uncharacterized protein LOC117187400 [Drosophila miranda]
MAAVGLELRDVIVLVGGSVINRGLIFRPFGRKLMMLVARQLLVGQLCLVIGSGWPLDRRLGTSIGAARAHAFACAGDLGPPHLAQSIEWIVVGPLVVVAIV